MTRRYYSPCKINLGLEVLSRRADGYHNIETVFFRLDEPFDEIEVADAEYFQFTCSDPELLVGENLIVKAIQKCAELHGKPMPGLHIHLHKHLPIGAGIGGGSANAATAIEIYSEYVAPITPAEKLELGASLGADVAFFVTGFSAAIGTGRGDILSPIELHIQQTVLLVKLQDTFISTKEAYENLDETTFKDKSGELRIAASQPIETWRETIKNDFEPFAFTKYPQLASVKEMMYSGGAKFALMSGSGSLIYGFFDTLDSAITGDNEIRRIFPNAYSAIV